MNWWDEDRMFRVLMIGLALALVGAVVAVAYSYTPGRRIVKLERSIYKDLKTNRCYFLPYQGGVVEIPCDD